MKLLQRINHIFGAEEGVTSLEYALIAALVAAVIVAGVTLLGNNVSTQFSSVAVII